MMESRVIMWKKALEEREADQAQMQVFDSMIDYMGELYRSEKELKEENNHLKQQVKSIIDRYEGDENVMYVKDLHKKQEELDNLVSEKNKSGYVPSPADIIFCFKTELYELANEIEFFKHWKKNKGKGNELGEYVDCLHFLLSIGNLYGINLIEVEIPKSSFVHTEDDFYQLWGTIENHLRDLPYGSQEDIREAYSDLFRTFLDLGDRLGFSEKKIREAYLAKWYVNVQRQKDNY